MNNIEPLSMLILFAWTMFTIILPITSGIIMDYYKNPAAVRLSILD